MHRIIYPLLALLCNTGLVAGKPNIPATQSCVPSSLDSCSTSTLSNFHLNVSSQLPPRESFVLSVSSSDRLIPTLSTLQANPPIFNLNRGFLTYKGKVFGRSLTEDKSLLPKPLFFLDKKEAQQATFEAVFICDEEGKMRRVLRGTVNSEGDHPDVIVAIERSVGGALYVPLIDQQKYEMIYLEIV